MNALAEKEWVEVGLVSTELEGQLIRSALEASGIDVLFRTFLPASVYPGMAPIRILVPGKDLELARKVLSQSSDEPGDQDMEEHLV